MPTTFAALDSRYLQPCSTRTRLQQEALAGGRLDADSGDRQEPVAGALARGRVFASRGDGVGYVSFGGGRELDQGDGAAPHRDPCARCGVGGRADRDTPLDQSAEAFEILLAAGSHEHGLRLDCRGDRALKSDAGVFIPTTGWHAVCVARTVAEVAEVLARDAVETNCRKRAE
jgi:hypothetical protein